VLRLYTFYFPGWKAYVDGQPVEITLSEPEGWITFWVPAGEHTVRVQLEETLPRLVGWGLTALALLGLAALVVWRLRLPVTPPAHDRLPLRPAALVLGAVVVGGLGLRAVSASLGWWQLHSYGKQVLVAQVQRYAPLQDNVALLGFDLPRTSARPGQTVPVTLYWKALAPVPVNLRVFVHFIGPDGQLWGQSDKWNPADFPTGRWPLDHYVRDDHDAQLRLDAPPGRYQVIAGLWDPDTGQRMFLLDSAGHSTGQDGILLTDSFEVTP
jgi:hypothetical protein